jgi:hypothetical protein
MVLAVEPRDDGHEDCGNVESGIQGINQNQVVPGRKPLT